MPMQSPFSGQGLSMLQQLGQMSTETANRRERSRSDAANRQLKQQQLQQSQQRMAQTAQLGQVESAIARERLKMEQDQALRDEKQRRADNEWRKQVYADTRADQQRAHDLALREFGLSLNTTRTANLVRISELHRDNTLLNRLNARTQSEIDDANEQLRVGNAWMAFLGGANSFGSLQGYRSVLPTDALQGRDPLAGVIDSFAQGSANAPIPIQNAANSPLSPTKAWFGDALRSNIDSWIGDMAGLEDHMPPEQALNNRNIQAHLNMVIQDAYFTGSGGRAENDPLLYEALAGLDVFGDYVGALESAPVLAWGEAALSPWQYGHTNQVLLGPGAGIVGAMRAKGITVNNEDMLDIINELKKPENAELLARSTLMSGHTALGQGELYAGRLESYAQGAAGDVFAMDNMWRPIIQAENIHIAGQGGMTDDPTHEFMAALRQIPDAVPVAGNVKNWISGEDETPTSQWAIDTIGALKERGLEVTSQAQEDHLAKMIDYWHRGFMEQVLNPHLQGLDGEGAAEAAREWRAGLGEFFQTGDAALDNIARAAGNYFAANYSALERAHSNPNGGLVGMINRYGDDVAQIGGSWSGWASDERVTGLEQADRHRITLFKAYGLMADAADGYVQTAHTQAQVNATVAAFAEMDINQAGKSMFLAETPEEAYGRLRGFLPQFRQAILDLEAEGKGNLDREEWLHKAWLGHDDELIADYVWQKVNHHMGDEEGLTWTTPRLDELDATGDEGQQTLRQLDDSPIIQAFVDMAKAVEYTRRERIRHFERANDRLRQQTDITAGLTGQNEAIMELLREQGEYLEGFQEDLMGDTP